MTSAGALMRANRRKLEELASPEVERDELRDLTRSIAYPEGWFYVERASASPSGSSVTGERDGG
jgi:hypothetical protein